MKFQISATPSVSEDAQLTLKLEVSEGAGISMDSKASFNRRTSLALAVEIFKARGLEVPRDAMDVLAMELRSK